MGLNSIYKKFATNSQKNNIHYNLQNSLTAKDNSFLSNKNRTVIKVKDDFIRRAFYILHILQFY